MVGAAFMTTIAVFIALLIHMIKKEHRVRAITLIATVVTLGALGIVLFPVYGFLLQGPF
jgi:hypothetical protein